MLLKVLILFSWLISEPNPLTEIQIYRQEYQRISVTQDAITKILNTSKTSTLSGTTSEAYAAAAFLCSAKYKSSMLDSYQTFNKGSALLDAVIKKDTSNIDARYIRYTIQLKAPAFLGYTGHCKRDRAFLLSQLPRLRVEDASMYALVQAFMLVHDEKAKAVLTTKSSTL
jgi:hypothetical protein